ncbi:MAG: glycosyltransferase family 4 protein [Deltaproteobacteria bacterium]|nr:glycosyltransferase family 4 protein [Deltaproteobacteria bacterium]
MASILLLGVKVPFTKGGQDVLVGTLMRELRARGHDVDLIELPFKCPPKESLLNQAALWRSLDLSNFGGRDVDLVIGTKFPSYFAKHPKKSLWLVHQHRPIYDLHAGPYSDFSDDPRDEALRRMLADADQKAIRECQYISGISKNVVDRLAHFNGIEGEVLYPPLPLGQRYACAEPRDYILSVGRLCGIKRVDLMLKALPIVHPFMKLKIVGTEDEKGVLEYFKNEVEKHHLTKRVEFLGRVDDDALLKLYSEAFAVYYAPHNEDYGYVTLEAMASGKPVITAHDSGGTLEWVQDGVNGIVVSPTIDAIGHGVNRLIDNRAEALVMGQRGQELIESAGVGSGSWDRVVNSLLSPLG